MGGLLVSPCPSIHLSIHRWTELCPFCSFHNTILLHFIFLHILSANFRKCAGCWVLQKNVKFEFFSSAMIWEPLSFPCVFIWLWPLIPPMTLTLNFKGQMFKIAISQELVVRLIRNERDMNQYHVGPTIWLTFDHTYDLDLRFWRSNV